MAHHLLTTLLRNTLLLPALRAMVAVTTALAVSAGVTSATSGCGSGKSPAAEPVPLTRPRTDRTYLRDQHGRYLLLHGINVSGSSKVPARISPEGVPSYVGKPFPVEQARARFADIRTLGFDAVRLLVIWEGLEPRRRGEYDTEYLRSLREMVKTAGEAGLYVLLDMHQDMWSRHLFVKYNAQPAYGAPGSIENTLLALVEPYTDVVAGDGAPRWAVEACLPEKDLSSPHWGTPRVVSGLGPTELLNLYELYKKLAGGGGDQPLPDWVAGLLLGLPGEFAVNQTSDLLPFTQWGAAHALSLDVARCYACFFAGDQVFPTLKLEGKGVQGYLQDAFAAAWVEVAKQVAGLPNVLGYDLFNEPSGNYLVLAAVVGMLRAGVADGARDVLIGLLGPETGGQTYDALLALRLLPPDTMPETLTLWGLDKLDVLAALDLNYGFDENHLRPFYEKVGQAILAVDPDAVFFIESSLSATTIFGGSARGGIGGKWEVPLTRPAGLTQVVYAPHWYADIYPFLGFNQPPRSFSVEEVRYRDYRPELEEARLLASYSLGNVPTVFGEFGAYFNYGGIERSRADGYAVSAALLDNYYQAMEAMLVGQMLWCYSPENDYQRGDGWNREDFSVLDPAGKPRGELAFARPHARALAGKPLSTHFYSDFHYFDPDKGVPVARREFEVRYASKETRTPSEIVVPAAQYPEGFFVWLSDGSCTYDPKTQTLYHFPGRDDPGAEHWVRLLPPLPGRENLGWRYFFRGDQVLSKGSPEWSERGGEKP